MGITDFFSAAWDTFSYPSPDADETPSGKTSTQSPASGTDEQSPEEEEVNKQDAKEPEESDEVGHKPGDNQPSVDEDEEEEEEEEEEQDPKDVFEAGKLCPYNLILPRVDTVQQDHWEDAL